MSSIQLQQVGRSRVNETHSAGNPVSGVEHSRSMTVRSGVMEKPTARTCSIAVHHACFCRSIDVQHNSLGLEQSARSARRDHAPDEEVIATDPARSRQSQIAQVLSSPLCDRDSWPLCSLPEQIRGECIVIALLKQKRSRFSYP